jgi:hypothetical protein
LGPFFERFFILGGPRGFLQKKLQDLDSMQLEGGFGGMRDRFDLICPNKVIAYTFYEDTYNINNDEKSYKR